MSYALPLYIMPSEGGAVVLVDGVGWGGWALVVVVVVVVVLLVVCMAVEVDEADEEDVGCLNLLDV